MKYSFITFLEGVEITEKDVTDAILSVLSSCGKTPIDVNEGDCDDFAEKVIELLGGETDKLKIRRIKAPRGGWHSYIKFKNKVYDAETPYGVNHISQFPWLTRYKIDPESGQWVKV